MKEKEKKKDGGVEIREKKKERKEKKKKSKRERKSEKAWRDKKKKEKKEKKRKSEAWHVDKGEIWGEAAAPIVAFYINK